MHRSQLIFYLVAALILLASLAGLNYNTPFNDEAIYIVIGRLGLFAGDWWTYGAGFWMAGLPYIYPSLTALAFQTGGIIGSRLLNVIFGLLAVEEVYRLTKKIAWFDQVDNRLAATIAAAVTGFSAVGLFVSRLATYDMPGFLFLLIAINSFLKAKDFSNGKYYFISAGFLLLSLFTKIVAAVFYPPLLLLSLVLVQKRGRYHFSFYWKYFLAPLAVGLLAYAVFFTSQLLIFTQTHIDSGTDGTSWDILRVIWENIGMVLLFSVASVPAWLKSGKSLKLAALLILSLVIPAFHFYLNRVPTLNKHLYLTVVFLSPVIGCALVWLAGFFSSRLLRPAYRVALFLLLIFYLGSNRPVLYRLEHTWLDSSAVSSFLVNKITPQDRVLTENGAAVILALYDKIYPPTQITTFDWIDYSGLKGLPGYSLAIKDGYFDYIQLDGQHNDTVVYSLVVAEMSDKYQLIYQQDPFKVYAKTN